VHDTRDRSSARIKMNSEAAHLLLGAIDPHDRVASDIQPRDDGIEGLLGNSKANEWDGDILVVT